MRSYISAYMMETTIGRMFELLIGPPVRTDSEIAELLHLDLAAVRARLFDLRWNAMWAALRPDQSSQSPREKKLAGNPGGRA
jgi:hypothetical protein